MPLFRFTLLHVHACGLSNMVVVVVVLSVVVVALNVGVMVVLVEGVVVNMVVAD